jgi:5,10-methylenetetrahydromethanopterin reductase
MLSPDSKPKLGISLRATPRTLELINETARRYGKETDFIGVYDELGDIPPFLHLYELARSLSSDAQTQIGPVGIAVPKHQTMADVVSYTALLSRMRSGNVFLGLVPGARMEKVGLKPASVDQMREAVKSSLYLWKSKSGGYKGKYFSIEPNFATQTQPDYPLPILIGAWGERMATLAGEIANVIEIGSCANPAMVPIMQERIRRGAEKAGRNPKEIALIFGAVTVIDQDRDRALKAARRHAIYLINNTGRNDPTVVNDFPKELAAIEAEMAKGNWKEAAAHLPEAMLNRFVLAGTPGDVIQRAEEIFDAGASGIEFGTPHHATDQAEGIRFLVEQIFPYFRRKQTG